MLKISITLSVISLITILMFSRNMKTRKISLSILFFIFFVLPTFLNLFGVVLPLEPTKLKWEPELFTFVYVYLSIFFKWFFGVICTVVMLYFPIRELIKFFINKMFKNKTPTIINEVNYISSEQISFKSVFSKPNQKITA